jgi:hypothetical protein
MRARYTLPPMNLLRRAFHSPPTHQIELRVARVRDLFNSMDPTPFHQRGLDRDAQAYLESWALEFSPACRFRIVVHVADQPDADPQAEVEAAIHSHFRNQAELVKRSVRTLFLEGRIALLVGLAVLSSFVLLADLIAVYGGTSHLLKIVRESLVIGGWVAMWRPMSIYLYEWWPLARRRRIYVALSHAAVHVPPASPKHH